jgi:hypothetical protein
MGLAVKRRVVMNMRTARRIERCVREVVVCGGGVE